MPNPIRGGNVFIEDPLARYFHEEGLKAELSGDYISARNSFYQGIMELYNRPLSAARQVQLASILRDDGFTSLRQSIFESEPEKLAEAEEILNRSKALTGRLVRWSRIISSIPGLPIELTSPELCELGSEHGATISLLGRLATVNHVQFGRNDVDPTSMYEEAHDYLRSGSNGYYRVSNAMVAARWERIQNNLPEVFRWLGRSTSGLAWTAAHNPANLVPAGMTFAGRVGHLRSWNGSFLSVAVKP